MWVKQSESKTSAVKYIKKQTHIFQIFPKQDPAVSWCFGEVRSRASRPRPVDWPRAQNLQMCKHVATVSKQRVTGGSQR